MRMQSLLADPSTCLLRLDVTARPAQKLSHPARHLLLQNAETRHGGRMSKASEITHDSLAPRPLRTSAPEVLAPLHEVNEHCLDLVVFVSKLDPEDAFFAMVGPLCSLL